MGGFERTALVGWLFNWMDGYGFVLYWHSVLALHLLPIRPHGFCLVRLVSQLEVSMSGRSSSFFRDLYFLGGFSLARMFSSLKKKRRVQSLAERWMERFQSLGRSSVQSRVSLSIYV